MPNLISARGFEAPRDQIDPAKRIIAPMGQRWSRDCPPVAAVSAICPPGQVRPPIWAPKQPVGQQTDRLALVDPWRIAFSNSTCATTLSCPRHAPVCDMRPHHQNPSVRACRAGLFAGRGHSLPRRAAARSRLQSSR